MAARVVDRIDVRTYTGRIRVTTESGGVYDIEAFADRDGKVKVNGQETHVTHPSAYPPSAPLPLIVRGHEMVFVTPHEVRTTYTPVRTIELLS